MWRCRWTPRAEVAEAALHAGVNAINDVSAGSKTQMFGLAADKGCRFGADAPRSPATGRPMERCMVHPPAFEDVVVEVRAALEGRAEAAEAAGVSPDAIVLDPGWFGKDVDQNWILLQRFAELSRGEALVGCRQSKVVHRGGNGCSPRDRVLRLAGCRGLGHAGRGRNSSGPRRLSPCANRPRFRGGKECRIRRWAVGFAPLKTTISPSNDGDHHVRTAVHRRFQL